MVAVSVERMVVHTVVRSHLAHDELDTPAELRDDCARGRRATLRLDRIARAAVAGAPSLDYDDFPREVRKRDIAVTEAAAQIATRCTSTWTDWPAQAASSSSLRRSLRSFRPACVGSERPGAQWNESPQAHEPVALGLSIVKPCFSMVSTKSIIAPLR